MSHTLDPQAVLEWYYQHGRHDLPWQQEISPYRVWVSEIMLQQTQVATVIPYYQRFMQRFPDVDALAAAPLDEVLHLWTGLGYYARARNLHRTATIVVSDHGGRFPAELDGLSALPGIGQSTAGAILAIGHGKRGVILDGNVRRVLCRFYAIDQWPGSTAAQRQLWALAEAATPHSEVAAYTQAIMDIGATVCTRSRPVCPQCPLQTGCQALANGQTSTLPMPRPRKALPERQTIMVLFVRDGTVLLQQRDASGLWGGLWSLPEVADEEMLQSWLQAHGAQLRERWPALRHTFSHFHLDIQPVIVEHAAAPARAANAVAEPTPSSLWYPLAPLKRPRRTMKRPQRTIAATRQGELDVDLGVDPDINAAPSSDIAQPAPQIGMAAPVKKLLQQLASRSTITGV